LSVDVTRTCVPAAAGRYDLVVLAVPHREYLAKGAGWLRGLLAENGTLADLNGALGRAADWRR
jgi:UDP-N-acetyl-D-galactosamine dehydrogenase